MFTGTVEVREGARRGLNELGNEMKLTKRSLILLGARAMLPDKTEPCATCQGRQPRAITSRESTRKSRQTTTKHSHTHQLSKGSC